MEEVKVPTNLKELIEAFSAQSATIVALEARVKALEAPKSSKASEKEMTDVDATRVTYGDLKDMKHKDAAAELGLTYGQIYSCRLGFTFKAVHKAAKDAGTKNAWTK